MIVWLLYMISIQDQSSIEPIQQAGKLILGFTTSRACVAKKRSLERFDKNTLFYCIKGKM